MGSVCRALLLEQRNLYEAFRRTGNVLVAGLILMTANIPIRAQQLVDDPLVRANFISISEIGSSGSKFRAGLGEEI